MITRVSLDLSFFTNQMLAEMVTLGHGGSRLLGGPDLTPGVHLHMQISGLLPVLLPGTAIRRSSTRPRPAARV